jgi:signal transduction histidine kinase
MVLSSTVGFKDVLPKLYELLSNAMHVKHVTFALSLHKRVDMPIDLVQKKGEYALYHFGEFCRRAALPSYLEKVVPAGQKALLYDDLAYVESKKLDRSVLRLKKWMDEQEIGVILPLSINDELIGYMIVGEKKNGDAFTSEDIGVLETFAMQAAIGIENILLFMYSRDFNKRLSISVEQATAQLKEKNRTLELLRKMDSIITTTLEQDDVCQKAVDTLSWELGYDIAYLSLLDQETGRLVPRAIAHTPIGEKAAAIFAGYEYSFEVDVADQSHPIARVFQTGVRFETEHLTEVFAARVPDVILGQLHEIHEIRGVFVLPIYAKQRVVGTLIVTFPEVPDKVSQAEREILDEFVKEVGIALDNAMLYEEVKRANQALIDTNKRLIELDRMKDEFVSIASHELRTPMTAINSYVWMALNKGGELPAKARDYLDKVSISTQRLISLVEDMLSVSRIESGRVKIELVNFELTALIAEVVEELQIKAHERSLELIFEGSEKEFVVHGDKNKTREVLTNLVGNALKFTDHGKVTITVREHGGMMEVSVIDTGRGIAESDMQRLFTKFGRLENELSTIAQTHGTGLGLYICKKYMEAMHGEIGVESKLGEGSRFWFRLSKGDVA